MRSAVELLFLLLPLTCQQSIQIDWSDDGVPTLSGFDDVGSVEDPEQEPISIPGIHVAGEGAKVTFNGRAVGPSPVKDKFLADMYEQRWWIDGHGEDDETTWFSQSTEPRTVRPDSDKAALQIGQTYTHQVTGARGVVIGWDARVRAPRRWIDSVDHWEGKPRRWADRLHRLSQPFHSVLEVSADGEAMQRYVISHCRPLGHALERTPCLQPDGRPVEHPDIPKYFVGWNVEGGHYDPRPELAQRYPRDVGQRALHQLQHQDTEDDK
jgi:hemimethylated DNA binding protein